MKSLTWCGMLCLVLWATGCESQSSTVISAEASAKLEEQAKLEDLRIEEEELQHQQMELQKQKKQKTK